MKKNNDQRRKMRGQSLVEFALLLPILLYFLCGVFDLGRAVFAFGVISSASRDGARYAIVHDAFSSSPYTTTDIQNVVDKGASGLDSSLISVSVSPSSGSSLNAYSAVTITVTYTYSPITPIVNRFVTTIPLKAETTMLAEQ